MDFLQIGLEDDLDANRFPSPKADLQRFIERDLSSIDVVLLSDRWAQSLVVLRRYLGWNAEDVMHLPSFLDLPPHMTKWVKRSGNETTSSGNEYRSTPSSSVRTHVLTLSCLLICSVSFYQG